MGQLRLILGFLAVVILASCGSSRKARRTDSEHHAKNPNKENGTDQKRELRQKYAALLHTSPGNIDNLRLYGFVDEWLGTPYRLGGNDKNGLDCSGLTTVYSSQVLGKPIPRTSATQFDAAELKPEEVNPAEGDLLFFNSPSSKRISHVGIYLQNDFFLHAVSRGGVKISSLQEAYWKKCFVAAGRIQ